MRTFLEYGQCEVVAVPIDTTGAAVSGDWMSLKGYSRATFIIAQGATAGGTPAVTLKQATAVAGTGTKALPFAEYFSKVALTGADWVAAAVTSDTFNLTATANKITAIQVDASSLDVAGGFDCVQVAIASPGANANLIAVICILDGARYPNAVALTVDAKLD